MIFHFFGNALEIVVDVSGHDLRVALRLGDVGMPEHLTDMLDWHTMPEHPCGEGVSGHVTMQRSLDATGHPEGLQAEVVVGVIELWHLPAVSLQDSNNGRQQLRGVRHTSLDPFARILPNAVDELVVRNIKRLRIRVGETSV